MNQVEEAHGSPSLVRLKVADQVPAHRGRFQLQLFDLPLRLLHAVLAEVREARGDRLSDERRGVWLADGDERYLARVAPGAPGARLYATPHLLDSRAQTRRLRPQLDSHCCNSVSDGVEYNKRGRGSAHAPTGA